MQAMDAQVLIYVLMFHINIADSDLPIMLKQTLAIYPLSSLPRKRNL